MDNEKIIQALRKHTLFSDTEYKDLEAIVSESELLTLKDEEYFINENETTDELYFIVSGTAKVVRNYKETGASILIKTLGPGELIGELSFIDSFPRSTSVKAGQGLVLLKFAFDRKIIEGDQGVYKGLLARLTKEITHKLRFTNENIVNNLSHELEVTAYRRRVGSYFFLLYTLLSVWILTYFIAAAMESDTLRILSSWGALLGVLLGTLNHLIRSNRSSSYFGFTLADWKKNVREAVLYSFPLLVVMIIVKWLVESMSSELSGHPLFSVLSKGGRNDGFWVAGMSLAYLVFIPFQEIFLRGIIQTSVKDLLGERIAFWHIVLPNIFFSVIFGYVSPPLALAAFIPGCFYGWLKHHQQSVVGPIAAHLFMVGGCYISMLNMKMILGAFFL